MGKKTIKGLDYPLKKSKKLDAALEAGSKTGSVAIMSPKKYLEHAKRLPDTKEDRLLIESFKSRMQKGKKFKPLKLLGHNQADGRHRATAAEEIGIKEVPVIDYRESGLKKMKGVHSVSQKGSKVGKIEEELRKERASGGQVNAAHLPLEDHDPNAAFRKLIAWSFAVAPLFSHPRLNRADGGEVEGDVQFAPEEDTPNLPTFAQQDPQESIRAALEAAKSLPEKREATLSAYEPTIGEKIYGAVAGLGSERPSPERRRFAEGVSELAGFTPGLGNVMAAQEAKRAGERGSYGEMALASLGALPMVGPTEKKAAETAVNVARRLTDLGHYSPAAEAATALKQEKGPASQMLGALKNLPGVKPEELKWSGIEGAFQPSEPVTRQQIMDYLHENLPQVKETTLGRDRINLVQNEEEPHIFEVYHAGDPEGQHYGQVGEIVQNPAGRYTVNVPGLFRHNFATVEEARDYINRASDIGSTTKYHSYTIPGGENYREVLMHLPEKQNAAIDFGKSPATSLFEKDMMEKYGGNSFTSVYNKLSPSEVDKYEMYVSEDRNAAKTASMLQDRANNYKSSHWDEPNVLGHLRMSDRTGPQGEKILHLEELQSDWGQEGRKKGFGKSLADNWELKEQEPGFYHLMKKGSPTIHASGDINKVMKEAEQYGAVKEGPPTAPYVTNTQNWTDLGLKRALREAAEGGYDKMIWTPGAEQVARYDLSKHIESVSYDPNEKYLSAIGHNGGQVISEYGVEPHKLDELVGKEVADKLRRESSNATSAFDEYEIYKDPETKKWGLNLYGDPHYDYSGEEVLFDSKSEAQDYLRQMVDEEIERNPPTISGLDLKVGGEGMRSFYDKIVPTQLSKLIKKLDPKAKIEMGGHKLQGEEGDIDSHVLHITPELRKRILEGLPAYERGGSIVDHALEVLSKHRK